MALRFPLADANIANSSWARRESYTTDKGTWVPARSERSVSLDNGTARLFVLEVPGEWLGTVELEVPRLYGGSRGLCTADEARAAVVDLLLLLARRGVLVPLCPHCEAGGCDAACLLGRVQMTRVDIGMDFADVKDSGAYVSLVQNTAQKGKPRIKSRYPSGIKVGWKKGRYLVTVYDKHLQAPQYAPEGTLRVEVTLRKSGLARCGIRWLQDVEEQRIQEAFSGAFTWPGLGGFVGGSMSASERINGLEESPTRRAGVLGYLYARSEGVALGLSQVTVRGYEELARSVGLVPGEPLRESVAARRRLDLESGREVPVSGKRVVRRRYTRARGGQTRA